MEFFNPSSFGGRRVVYCTRNAKITPAKEVWPNRTDVEGIYVLIAEAYIHDDWRVVRTSAVVDVTDNDVHTLNSIYRVIDAPVVQPETQVIKEA